MYDLEDDRVFQAYWLSIVNSGDTIYLGTLY